MIDNHFRSIIPRYTQGIIKAFQFFSLTPNQITWAGFIISLFAAYLVWKGLFLIAAAVWWISRILDACDGIFARQTGQTSLYGAFLDIQLDMASYSAMIVAFFLHFPEYSLQWVLILFCYVLCISGALSLGSLENKLGLHDKSQRGLRLAAGLAEGGETGIAYTLFLLLPDWIAITTWVWVGILTITIVARLLLARNKLGKI